MIKEIVKFDKDEYNKHFDNFFGSKQNISVIRGDLHKEKRLNALDPLLNWSRDVEPYKEFKFWHHRVNGDDYSIEVWIIADFNMELEYIHALCELAAADHFGDKEKGIYEMPWWAARELEII